MQESALEAARGFSDKCHQPAEAVRYWSKHRNNWCGQLHDWGERRFAAQAMKRLAGAMDCCD